MDSYVLGKQPGLLRGTRLLRLLMENVLFYLERSCNNANLCKQCRYRTVQIPIQSISVVDVRYCTSHHTEATEAVGKVKRIAPCCLCDQSERSRNNANADSTVQIIPIQIQSIRISVVDIYPGRHSIAFGSSHGDITQSKER